MRNDLFLTSVLYYYTAGNAFRVEGFRVEGFRMEGSNAVVQEHFSEPLDVEMTNEDENELSSQQSSRQSTQGSSQQQGTFESSTFFTEADNAGDLTRSFIMEPPLSTNLEASVEIKKAQAPLEESGTSLIANFEGLDVSGKSLDLPPVISGSTTSANLDRQSSGAFDQHSVDFAVISPVISPVDSSTNTRSSRVGSFSVPIPQNTIGGQADAAAVPTRTDGSGNEVKLSNEFVDKDLSNTKLFGKNGLEKQVPIPPSISHDIGGPFFISLLSSIAAASGYVPALGNLFGYDANLAAQLTTIFGSAGTAVAIVFGLDSKMCVITQPPKGWIGTRVMKAMYYLNRTYLDDNIHNLSPEEYAVEYNDRLIAGTELLLLSRKMQGSIQSDLPHVEPSPLPLLTQENDHGGNASGSLQMLTDPQTGLVSLQVAVNADMNRRRRGAPRLQSCVETNNLQLSGVPADLIPQVTQEILDNLTEPEKVALVQIGGFILNASRKMMSAGGQAFCTRKSLQAGGVASLGAWFALQILGTTSASNNYYAGPIAAAATVGVVTPYLAVQHPYTFGGTLVGGTAGMLISEKIVPCMAAMCVQQGGPPGPWKAGLGGCALGAGFGHLLKEGVNSQYPVLSGGALLTAASTGYAALINANPWVATACGASFLTYCASDQIGDTISHCIRRVRRDKGKKGKGHDTRIMRPLAEPLRKGES